VRLHLLHRVQLITVQKGRGRAAPPPTTAPRRLVAGALAACIVCVCVIATVASKRDPSPRFRAPFATTVAIAYDVDGRPVVVPAPQDRVLIYVSEGCGYCRDELVSWEALMRGREGAPKPTLVLSPESTTVPPAWLPAPFRSGWIHDRDGAVAEALGIRGVPFTAVVGSKGIIQEVWAGANPHGRRVRLLAQLEEAVGERP